MLLRKRPTKVGAALAAGEDINGMGHRHAPTALGPGNECRDDNGV
jgi:hypothetical protein